MSAVAEVTTLTCPECGAPVRLRPSRYGLFYGCTTWPKCNGTHGAHPDGKPLGTPGNRETKDARIRAHAAFDTLWKNGGMKRKEAYRWMQDTLGMSQNEAHIGSFDVATCERLITAVHSRAQHAAADRAGAGA